MDTVSARVDDGSYYHCYYKEIQLSELSRSNLIISSHLQHTYFSQRNLLNHWVVFRLHKLLDGDYLVSVSVSALEHNAVGTLTNFGQLFIFLHGWVVTCQEANVLSLVSTVRLMQMAYDEVIDDFASSSNRRRDKFQAAGGVMCAVHVQSEFLVWFLNMKVEHVQYILFFVNTYVQILLYSIFFFAVLVFVIVCTHSFVICVVVAELQLKPSRNFNSCCM